MYTHIYNFTLKASVFFIDELLITTSADYSSTEILQIDVYIFYNDSCLFGNWANLI